MRSGLQSPPDAGEVEHARAGMATATASVWLLAAWAVAAAASVVINIVAARLFPKAFYGNFALVMATLVWVEYAVSATFPVSYQKLASESVDNLPVIYSSVLRLCLPVCIGLWAVYTLAAPLIARALGDPGLTGFLLWAGPDIPVLGLYVALLGVLNGTGRTAQNGLAAAGYALGRMVFITGAMLALTGLGCGPERAVSSGLLAKAFASAIGLGIALWFLRRIPHGRPQGPQPSLAGHVWRFGLPLGVTTVALYLLIDVDFWLVKRLLASDEATAYYGAARAVAFLAVFVGVAMRNAVFPSMAINLHRGRTRQGIIALRTGLRVVLVVVGLLWALLPATSGELSQWLFRYDGAGPPMALLAVATGLFAALMVYVSAFAAADRPLEPFFLLLALAPLAVTGHLLLIPRLGVLGAAAVTLGALAVGVVTAAVRLWMRLGARPPVTSLLRVAASAAFVGVLSGRVPAAGPWLLPKYAVMAVVYAALLLALREVRLSEVTQLLGSVRGRLARTR